MVAPWTRAAPDPVDPFSRAQRGAAPPRVALGNGIEHFSGNGDPNGIRRARLGSHFTQRDAIPIPAVWINIDGAFAWVQLASLLDICDECGCMMARNGDSDDFTWEPDVVLRYGVSVGGVLLAFSRSGGWWVFSSGGTPGGDYFADVDCPWTFGATAPTQTNLDFHWKGHPQELVGSAYVEVGLTECGSPPNANGPRVGFRTVLQSGVRRWIAFVTDGGTEDVYQDVLVTVGQTCPTRQLLRIQGTATGIKFSIDGVQIGLAPWTDPQTGVQLNQLLRRYVLAVNDGINQPSVFSDKWCLEQDEACVEGVT